MEYLATGDLLHTTGEQPKSVEAIVRGEVEARKNDRLLGSSQPGDLIGISCLLEASPAFYEAVVTRPTRVMRWQYQDLQKLISTDENLASALRKIAGAAIAQKLIRLIQGNDYQEDEPSS